eukprot:gnl/TRDRNA2_/TRDRNA2_162096_c0_seq1.p1 gnl/TRDRNA2_/TRDRNA2_162096_c0~~gnl/TRDRNA2_/TRDRNA2_162096_c0_seq1.p1  ORF type:complete len:304 (+),score=58.56 gnl/TRDRNA2_/TRDRNA2_162096_c0_seq1:159-1070(+)
MAAVASTGRVGPSGQELRGAEQKTLPVEVGTPASDNPLVTPDIEAENVHKVYETIAEHWNHTRYKAWPRVEEFIRSRPRYSLIADLGCGNGKNIPAIREAGCLAIVSDMSEQQTRIAAETHGADAFVGDCLCTPLRGGVFDAALSIAVLHHLSTVPRRVQALREGARLLRPGGELLVYCWSFEQDATRSASRHRFDQQDVLVSWSYRTPGEKKVKEQNASSKKGAKAPKDQKAADGTGADGDAAGEAAPTISWQDTPLVCQRYCHVYREGELAELLAQVPELEVVEIYFDTGNWCAIARKKPS